MMTTNEKYLLAAAILGVGAVLGYRYYQKTKAPVALQPGAAPGGALPPAGGGTPNIPASYQPGGFAPGTYKVQTTTSGLALRGTPDPNGAFVDLASLPTGLPVGTLVIANGTTQVSPPPASILYAQVQTTDAAHQGWVAADYLVPA